MRNFKPSFKAFFFTIAMLFAFALVSNTAEAQTLKKPYLAVTDSHFVANVTNNTIVPLVDISQLTPANVLEKMIDPIYSALVLIFGLLSSFIPGIQRLESRAVRVLAIGISLAIGFLLFGGATFWKLALSYVFANLSYIITFKGLFNRKAKEAPLINSLA